MRISFKIFVGLLLLSSTSYAATELKSAGVHKGYFNVLNVTNGITGDVSGITASITPDVASISPLSQKGDIWVYSTLNTRLPVGSDGTVLSSDSSTATGLKWVTPSAGGGGGTPGGSDKQVQFNNGGAFGGDQSFQWNSSTNTLSISRDVGQNGLAFAISSDTGVTLASISHDGGATFNSLTLKNKLSGDSGGTGQNTYTLGDLLQGNSSSSLSKVSIGSMGQILSADTVAGIKWVPMPTINAGTVTNSGTLTTNAVIIGAGTTVVQAITADSAATGHFLASTATSPAFRQILTSDVTGIHTVGQGGTSFSQGVSGGVVFMRATTSMDSSALLTSNAVVIGGGAATAPSTITADTVTTHALMATATSPAFRQILSSDINGTIPVASGGTGITSGTANSFIYFANAGLMASTSLISTDGTKMSIGPGTGGVVSFDVAGSARTLPFALTDAATIATDASRSNIFTVTLGGSRTLGTPTNGVHGQKVVWIISQDSAGSRTLAYSPAFRFGTTVTSPTLSTAAGKADYIGAIFNVRGTPALAQSWDVVAVSLGY